MEVDALRGFALFGLFIVHMVEYFELFWYAPEWGPVHDAVFFLFGGKAYAIFALLFGFSFSLMMGRQAQRGLDFRARFAWRLALLLVLGYLHGLLYSGDILQVLALTGLLLIALYPLGSRGLLVVAALGLLQAPRLVELGLALGGAADVAQQHHPGLMAETFAIYANGSFADVVQRNVWAGQLGKWLFMLESGRLWNVIGMFCVGVVLERNRFFETFGERAGRAFGAGLALLVLLAESRSPSARSPRRAWRRTPPAWPARSSTSTATTC
ncbi:MAG: heparan-alpha-glucosaminide N-acetyltransferase domain-containing protein [Xanthomonadales bacterium]